MCGACFCRPLCLIKCARTPGPHTAFISVSHSTLSAFAFKAIHFLLDCRDTVSNSGLYPWQWHKTTLTKISNLCLCHSKVFCKILRKSCCRHERWYCFYFDFTKTDGFIMWIFVNDCKQRPSLGSDITRWIKSLDVALYTVWDRLVRDVINVNGGSRIEVCP